MPRIAASVGVFALIVFSIAFNMIRYPRVWEMVGPPAEISQTEQSSQPVTTTEPAPAPQPEVDAPAATPQSPIPVAMPADDWREQPAPLAPDDDRYASFADLPGPYADATPPQEEVPSAAQYAALAGQIDELSRSPSERPLVPVVQPGARQGDAHTAQLDAQVCRLPPVEEDDPAAVEHLASRLSEQPIPVYPTTGIE